MNALRDTFPRHPFDHLEVPWWHTDPSVGGPIAKESMGSFAPRAEGFRTWLCVRPEVRIAVVKHGRFFFHFSGRFLDNRAFLTVRL